jgi:hypothetical protein
MISVYKKNFNLKELIFVLIIAVLFKLSVSDRFLCNTFNENKYNMLVFSVIPLHILFFCLIPFNINNQYYNKLNCFEIKRLISYNLMWVEENYYKNLSIVKEYSEQLKEEMDSIPNYKIEQADKYLSMLTYYLDSHKGEIETNELIEIYEYGYKYYKQIGKHIEQNNFKYNLEVTKRNFKEVLRVIENIHNNDIDIRYKVLLDNVIQDVKIRDIETYHKALKIIDNNTKHIV